MESICDAITKIHIKKVNKRISQPNSFKEFTYKEVLQQAQTTFSLLNLNQSCKKTAIFFADYKKSTTFAKVMGKSYTASS